MAIRKPSAGPGTKLSKLPDCSYGSVISLIISRYHAVLNNYDWEGNDRWCLTTNELAVELTKAWDKMAGVASPQMERKVELPPEQAAKAAQLAATNALGMFKSMLKTSIFPSHNIAFENYPELQCAFRGKLSKWVLWYSPAYAKKVMARPPTMDLEDFRNVCDEMAYSAIVQHKKNGVEPSDD